MRRRCSVGPRLTMGFRSLFMNACSTRNLRREISSRQPTSFPQQKEGSRLVYLSGSATYSQSLAISKSSTRR